MATDMALRFAKTSLSLYRHERMFSIGVGGEDDLDPIAEAFESIGCAVVKKDTIRLILTVSCGESEEAPLKRRHQPRPLPWAAPNLGDTIVLASHMRAIAREATERARVTRSASQALACQFAQDRERRKQDADRRGP